MATTTTDESTVGGVTRAHTPPEGALRRGPVPHGPSGYGALMQTTRRLGIEEELLLADAVTGELRPLAREVLAACAPVRHDEPGASIKPEFFLAQVEVASSPQTALSAVREELAGARARLAEAGRPLGVAPVAAAAPVLVDALTPTDELYPGERYAEVERHYGEVARRSLMCALHVHVEVADDEEGVAVIDRVRPWVPVLVALGANSPYWHGRDTGYASWRSRLWNMWPSSGPAELFGDAAAYHGVVRDMVSRRTALDTALVNLDVRLSHRYPTVEFRATDVCTDLDDAMVVAALARALVTFYADRWRAGAVEERWRVDELRGAAWQAARFGLEDTLLSPISRQMTAAVDVADELVALLEGPLESAGDAELVTRGLAALRARGNGATRQRAAFADTGGIDGVVVALRDRTANQ